MYKEKLPGEIDFMLKFDEELSCMNGKYLKVPINDNILAVYRNESCAYQDLELVLLYSKSKNDVIMCFDSHFATTYQLKDILFANLKQELFQLVKNEFLSVSDLVEVDIKTDLTPKILEKAKKHYLNNTNPQYTLSYHKVKYSIEDMIKMGENICDFAYEEMELLLENNKKELEDLKEHLLILEVLKESDVYFDSKENAEKLFYELSTNEKYKYLNFVLEETNGKVESVKVANIFANYKLYPIYAIKEIRHGRSILYEKDEEMDSYRTDKEYNLDFCKNEVAKYLSEEMLEDREFTKKFVKSNIWNFEFISNELKTDKEYIKELTLYLKNESIFMLTNLFNQLPDELKEDKDMIFFFFNPPISTDAIYGYLSPELQKDETVLDTYFSNKPDLHSFALRGGTSTWEHLLEDEHIRKAFQQYIHENISLTIVDLNNLFLKYIEDEKDALRFADIEKPFSYMNQEFFNFGNFNVNLRSDMDFVRKYFDIVRMKELNNPSFDTIFNYLTEEQKEENDFLCDLISYATISKKEYNELPTKVKTDKFNVSMVTANPNSLIYLSKEQQLDYLDTHPEEINCSFLANYDSSASEAMPFLKKMVKTRPELLASVKVLHSQELVELLKVNLDCFEYGIQNMYAIQTNVLEMVKDKVFVLDKIKHKSINSIMLSPEKIDFFKSQMNLPNYKFYHLLGIDNNGHSGLITDKELMKESVRITGWGTLEYLPNNSPLKEDKEFASDILQYSCSYLSWFKPIVRKDKDFLKNLYLGYSTKQKADLLCVLPKATAKELLSLDA